MTRTFSITSPSLTVSASRGRESTIRFTVRNTTDTAARGRAILVPLHGAEDSWISVDRDVERDFGPEQADEFDVHIRIPSAADPGRYSMRLDIAAVRNPDEDYTAGPEVAIEVDTSTPPVDENQTNNGYLVSLVGTAIGAIAATAVVGIVVAVVVFLAGAVDDLFDNLGTNAITAILLIPGPWLGAIAGVGLALRLRGYQAAWSTSAAMALLFPVWAVTIFLLVSRIGEGGFDGGWLLITVGAVVPALVIVLPALLARFLGLTVPSPR